jgi:hypothetical protein
MPMFPRVMSLPRNLLRKQRNDHDLDEEVRGYAEMLAEEKQRSGLTPAEARRQARIELVGVEQMKERVREVRAGEWLESLLEDARYGLRILRKNPGFTAVAILSLALGIVAALGVTRLLGSLLFDMRPNDPLMFAGAVVVLFGVALTSIYIPAERAARVDPTAALRP